MASLMTNLMYYASVARGNVVLAEHINSKEDLAEVAVECLEKVPQFHNRYTFTIKQRMFVFLMADSFTYSAIADEALGKLKAFGFLERVRDEFQLMLRSRGLDGSRLERNAMAADFAGVFKHLVKPLFGMPQKEVDLDDEHHAESKDHTALSPSASQTGSPSHHAHAGHVNGNHKVDRKSKKDEQVTEAMEIMMTNGKSLKYEGGDSSSDMENGMARKRCNARHVASKMWWRNVKRVLLLDLVVCCILFAIWLGICHGFSCVKN